MALDETKGWAKVIADAKTDKVLGVHMIGPDVTELIAEATLALGATAQDLALTIHADPLPEAGDGSGGDGAQGGDPHLPAEVTGQ